MLRRSILAALLSLGLASAAQATTITGTDTSSVADTLVCEAGTGGITVKKCPGPITASQVVISFDTTATANHLACMADSTGRRITDCGYSAISTLGAYKMLGNPSSVAAAPMEVAPTGLWGVPVLNDGFPIFIGSNVQINNSNNTSLPSALELRNTNPVVNTGADALWFTFVNNLDVVHTYGNIAFVPTNITSGSESGRIDISTYTAGASNYEARFGDGGQIGVPTGGKKGVGTLNVEKGIFPGIGIVSALPTCNSTAKGQIRVVTDANTTTFNATVSGGGANTMLSLCDGALWKIH